MPKTSLALNFHSFFSPFRLTACGNNNVIMPPCVPNISKHHLVKPGVPLRLIGMELTFSFYRWESPHRRWVKGLGNSQADLSHRSQVWIKFSNKAFEKSAWKAQRASERSRAGLAQDVRWIRVIKWWKWSKHILGEAMRLRLRHSDKAVWAFGQLEWVRTSMGHNWI